MPLVSPDGISIDNLNVTSDCGAYSVCGFTITFEVEIVCTATESLEPSVHAVAPAISPYFALVLVAKLSFGNRAMAIKG